MRAKLSAIILFLLTLCGCTTGFQGGVNFSPIIPIPSPDIDIPFRSITYYNAHYGIDLLKMNHDMEDEIRASHEATDTVYKYLGGIIKVNGQPVAPKMYNDKHLYNSKKLGPNDYSVMCSKITPIEKQIDNHFCWAACLQYFIMREYDVSITQEKIIDAIKKHGIASNQPATVVEIMKALGFTGLKWSKNGAHQLVETLGRNHVAILGKRNPSDNEGHAVIVIGARYSFVSGILSPSRSPGVDIAFSSLSILDPANGGGPISSEAEELDGNVDFVLSQSVVALDYQN